MAEPGPWVRLGSFVFDPTTGELECIDDGGKQRLSPQPAQLLALLIEHAGELVPHPVIRARLWGEVAVDFEQGLHFCVRQVRAALGDQAASPVYVENLPRRGYRLLVPVEPLAPQPTGAEMAGEPEPAAATSPLTEVAATTDDTTTRPPTRIQWMLVAAIVALFTMIAAGLVSVWFAGRATSPSAVAQQRVKEAAPDGGARSVAIMSFRPADDLDLEGDPVAIAEHILLRLGQVDVERLAVVGPTTTESYGSGLGAVRQLAETITVDYVLNGRWLPGDARPELLVELIRVVDGAHVWVKRFEPESDYEAVAEQAATATLAVLGLTVSGGTDDHTEP